MMVHRCEHLCSASQLWLLHPALCIVPPECFRGLHVWSRAVGSKSGKLRNVADHDTDSLKDGVYHVCGDQVWGESLEHLCDTKTKQKQNMFDGKTQQPHILCLGLAKCDRACGRMGITYVFDQVIKQVHGVMEIHVV